MNIAVVHVVKCCAQFDAVGARATEAQSSRIFTYPAAAKASNCRAGS
jgi:hypothetical protein